MPLTGEQYQAVLDLMLNWFAARPGIDFDQDMLNFLRTLPELTDAGILDTHRVWAAYVIFMSGPVPSPGKRAPSNVGGLATLPPWPIYITPPVIIPLVVS